MADLINIPLGTFKKAFLASPINGVQQEQIVLDAVLDIEFDGTTQYLSILDPDSPELISFTGQTDTGELTGVTRGLPLKKGGDSSAASHSANISVALSNPHQIFENIQNAMNSKLDESGGVLEGKLEFTGAENPGLRVAVLTDEQKNALANLENGHIVFVTDPAEGEGNLQFYGNGVWTTLSEGGAFINATENVGGKVELATIADQQAQTELGDNGSPLVMQAKNTTTISAGAEDAGKALLLNADGKVDDTTLNENIFEPGVVYAKHLFIDDAKYRDENFLDNNDYLYTRMLPNKDTRNNTQLADLYNNRVRGIAAYGCGRYKLRFKHDSNLAQYGVVNYQTLPTDTRRAVIDIGSNVTISANKEYGIKFNYHDTVTIKNAVLRYGIEFEDTGVATNTNSQVIVSIMKCEIVDGQLNQADTTVIADRVTLSRNDSGEENIFRTVAVGDLTITPNTMLVFNLSSVSVGPGCNPRFYINPDSTSATNELYQTSYAVSNSFNLLTGQNGGVATFQLSNSASDGQIYFDVEGDIVSFGDTNITDLTYKPVVFHSRQRTNSIHEMQLSYDFMGLIDNIDNEGNIKIIKKGFYNYPNNHRVGTKLYLVLGQEELKTSAEILQSFPDTQHIQWREDIFNTTIFDFFSFRYQTRASAIRYIGYVVDDQTIMLEPGTMDLAYPISTNGSHPGGTVIDLYNELPFGMYPVVVDHASNGDDTARQLTNTANVDNEFTDNGVHEYGNIDQGGPSLMSLHLTEI